MFKLIKSTGRLFVNSVNVLDAGVNILNKSAYELNHSMEKWSLEQSISYQYKKIDAMKEATHSELSEEYNVLIKYLESLQKIKPYENAITEQLDLANSRRQLSEQKRKTLDEFYFEGNQLKTSLPRLDGRLHGLAKSWYQDGTKRWQAQFLDGNISGEGNAWHPDGSRWFEYNRNIESKHVVVTVWPSNFDELSVRLVKSTDVKSKMNVEINFKGVHWGPIYYANGKIISSFFIFGLKSIIKIVMHPRLWKGLRTDVKRFQCLEEDAQMFQIIFHEISSLT
ncbi:hypothetical protein ACQKE9_14705 [Shewanella vesiculosa]|uniref:hypothetical protein n=1 Tax=Shewanella TaxID=22 RepID=UPI00331D6714